MMRAKADPKATSNSLLVLACVLLAGAAAGIAWPKPDTKAIQAKEKRDTAKLEVEVRKSRADAAVATATVAARTWTGEDAAVQAQVVTLTTTLASKRGLNVVRLQPQRITPGGALEQLPFLVVVEGPFPAVAAFERDLELPANRLAVSVFQISSSDSESNQVSASIGLVAHRQPVAVEEEKPNAKRTQS